MLRFATAVLIVCGVGVAAASVGVLPSGAQRIAHDYFGIGGASAPSTHVPSSIAVTTGAPRGNSGDSDGNSNSAVVPSTTSNAAPASSAVLVPLCQQVFQDPGKWEQDLGTADQATLITAAGSEQKVKSYCARLLASAGKDATPSHAATGAPPPAPSAAPTETHGKAHVSHSPGAKGNGNGNGTSVR